jgi:hypothetical protein
MGEKRQRGEEQRGKSFRAGLVKSEKELGLPWLASYSLRYS